MSKSFLHRTVPALSGLVGLAVAAGLCAPASGSAGDAGRPVAGPVAGPGARAGGAGAGTLDPSFSPNAPSGVTDFTPALALVDVAVQQDGRIVAVSDSGPDFRIARFNPDGSLDPSFASAGWATVDVGAAAQFDTATAVAIDAQNRIVVVGGGGALKDDFSLVRLTADGKAVQINTHVHVGNPTDASTAYDVAFQSDGTIVLAGSAMVGGDADFVLVRFNGTTGVMVDFPDTQTLSGGDDVARGVAVYPSGPNKDKVVLVGNEATAGIAVLQRTADDNADFTFDGAGQKVLDLTPGGDLGYDVAITASGSILLAGSNGTGDLVVIQLLPTGGFDPAFNAGTVRTLTKPGSDFLHSHALALQPNGKIVVIGDSANGQDIGVFRLNADGTSDPSFGTAGDATFSVGADDDAHAVALDQHGDILVAGAAPGASGFVARLFGSPDTDGDGVRDAVDACPTVAGPLPNGCPPPVLTPPAAVVKGTKVLIDTVLAKTKASAKCPRRAEVTVRTRTAAGKLLITQPLRSKAATGGCRVKGKVRLPAKPAKHAKVKVTIAGKKLRTMHLVAVRP